MNKFAKMAALLMSAVMCAFTSCGESSGDKHEDDVATIPVAKFALVTTPEVLGNVEGTVTATFQPSGKSQTLNIKDATSAIDTDIMKVLELFNSGVGGRYTEFIKQSGSVTYEFKGDINDTKCQFTRNIKVKDGLDLSADQKYYYQLLIPYKVLNQKGYTQAGTYNTLDAPLPGDLFQSFVEKNNTTNTVDLTKTTID